MLSSLIDLLPITEYGHWVREMTVAGLDFRNPVGQETFKCFKQVCVIERNTNESSRDYSDAREVTTSNSKTIGKRTFSVQDKVEEESEQESSVLAVKEAKPKP